MEMGQFFHAGIHGIPSAGNPGNQVSFSPLEQGMGIFFPCTGNQERGGLFMLEFPEFPDFPALGSGNGAGFSPGILRIPRIPSAGNREWGSFFNASIPEFSEFPALGTGNGVAFSCWNSRNSQNSQRWES